MTAAMSWTDWPLASAMNTLNSFSLKVSSGSRLERAPGMHRILVRREHQHARFGRPGEDAPHRLESADAGHRDVHDHDVGLRVLDRAHGVLAARRLGDHAHVRRAVDEEPEAHAHDRMVVDQHHADPRPWHRVMLKHYLRWGASQS